MATNRISDDLVWGERSWIHPNQLLGKGPDRLKKLLAMIFTMKRASKAHRTELEESLAIMAAAKTSSSIAAVQSARESL